MGVIEHLQSTAGVASVTSVIYHVQGICINDTASTSVWCRRSTDRRTWNMSVLVLVRVAGGTHWRLH